MADRNLIVYKLTTGSLYKVRYDGGGEIPETLSGKYTKKELALTAIEEYNKTKRKRTPKEKVDAKVSPSKHRDK